MQGDNKERVDDAEEALTLKTNPISDPKKEVTKEGKFAFRKMKQPKKEKSPKKAVVPRFEGEGIVFKAKLIGVEAVADARGDKMCQDAMQRLKLNVRNTGPHKRKINICVSMQGVKIKDEKFGNVIFHHPVSVISFISQDITDARAFGYVFGSTSEPHQFVAIKTDKPAFHVVLALRDLFQTVLDHKQVEIQNAKEQKIESSKENEMSSETTINQLLESSQASKPLEDSKVNENIYFEVLLTEPIANKKDIQDEPLPEPVKTVDDLIGLESEMHQLQEGINQMDTSIAAVVAFNTEVHVPENDPFDTSFVLGPKRDSFPLPMPTPVPLVTPVAPPIIVDTQQDLVGADKYAIFSAIDTIAPSVFQEPTAEEEDEEEEESRVVTAASPPPKPPRLGGGKSTPDMSVFADLDPLGKDRPYKDKTEFFQDVKNPPKKVLNDLVDHRVAAADPPFPVDFVSQPNPFVKTTTEPPFPPPSSVPIPIPGGGGGGESTFRERSVSNGYHSGTSLSSSAYCTTDSGSLYSKSPLNESDYSDYYISPPYQNGGSPSSNDLTKQNILNNHLSRPRPRPSKGGLSNHPRTVSSHSLSSDSSSDYEAISRESMQSIANALTGRMRAQSLVVGDGGRGKVGDIFARKADPFADDDFFFSLPKKNLLLLQQTTTEIPEFV